MDLKELTIPEMLTHVASLAEDDKDGLRAVADHLEVSYSGNTGAKKLRENIEAHLADKAAASTNVPDLSAPPAPPAPAPVLAAGGPSFDDTGPSDEDLDNDNDIDAGMAALLGQVQEEKEAQPEGPKVWTDEELSTVNIDNLSDDNLIRRAMRLQHLRLVRVRIVNLDPSDSELPGDIITIVNPYLGKVSKLIPYGEESENGYHVPSILLDHMRTLKFPMRKAGKRNQFGVKTYKTVMSPKFSITELPALTDKERDELAKRQAAAQSIDN